MKRRRLPSLISLLIGSIIVVLSVAGYFLLQHNVDQQETSLLASNTTDAGETAQYALSGVITGLSSTANVVQQTNASPSQFLDFAQLSKSSDVLVRKVGNRFVVVASPPTSTFHSGQALSGPALATVQLATGKDGVSGPVTRNGKVSDARFAVQVPPVPSGLYVYDQLAIPTHINLAMVIGQAFSNLNATLYGPGPPRSANLLIASTKSLPLAAPTAHTRVRIGGSNWTLIANARTPFVSGLASSGPLILLVMGLFLALVVTLTVETVQRRHRYAQALVDERTAELNESLHELKTTQVALVQRERLSAVGEMASVIGHELRNPLAAVTNALFIVRGDLGKELTPTTEKYLSMAERETSKAAVLADDLTAFVRPRDMVESEIDVPDLVDEVLSATPHPEHVQVDVEVAPISLVGDRGQLAEVLTNLVTNAYQAMPDGGTVRLEASCSDGHATFTVEDSGNGIQDGAMQRIFEPFFTTKDSGTGLGLAIVQRLVQAHGGEISLENAATGGVRDCDPAREGIGGEVNCVLLADVLVVDDEEPVRTSVAEILRAAGYSVAEAVDGQDALDMLESGSVKVLLLDIRMPRRTGIEVLQALDSPPNVILMSAYRFEGEDKRSVGHKVFSHLMKPVAPRQLLDEVRAAIDREDA